MMNNDPVKELASRRSDTVMLMRRLGLNAMADHVRTQFEQSSVYSPMSFEARLYEALQAQEDYETGRARERLISRAHFRMSCDMSFITVSESRGLSMQDKQYLISMDYLREHKNICIEAPSAAGKTTLCHAVGRHCCSHGHSVLYTRKTELMDEFLSHTTNAMKQRFRTRIGKIELIIFDDFGLDRLTENQCSALYDILDDRHDRLSTMFATQHSRKGLGKAVAAGGNRAVQEALVRRITGNAVTLKLKPAPELGVGYINDPSLGRTGDGTGDDEGSADETADVRGKAETGEM